MQQIVVTNVWW